MHNTVCCAMLALPMIGLNALGNFANSGLQRFDSDKSKITDFVSDETIVQQFQPYFTSFQISARDDRIKDCLRSGNCKN
ncbi:MAG: hypothetical protein KI793_22140 [Rivularia sp. (in: Bacteria)]|nr:hypothetical protein [Rivularia sp. MS3]